jgi:RNA polymerase sigma factor (sigma-70 family)
MTARYTQDELLALLPRLRRFARVLTADLQRADDLVLETLSSVSEAPDPPAPWTHIHHWPFGVMHRLYDERPAHEQRKQASTVGPDGLGARAPSSSPPSTLPDRAGTDEILERFSRLPVEQREVLALVVLEGLLYDEIAALLGVQVGTVLSRLRCARDAMHSVTAESRAHDSM